jgi:hypothetical protein
VPILRDKEKLMSVVIAMHMGLEEDLRTGNSQSFVSAERKCGDGRLRGRSRASM